MKENTLPRVLTIAGSDSGGGAGIQADLKTITALGGFGMSAITSVTAQNTMGVFGVHDIPPEMVAKQIDVVINDIGVDAVKIGMLSNAAIVDAVANSLREQAPRNLVIDPVMVAKSGDSLLQEEARQGLIKKLLPQADLVTPNIPEAEVLANMKIADEKSLREAGARILGYGVRYVLIKGGHMDGEMATDWLYGADGLQKSFSNPRIDTKNTHGTGCTYSAAIATYLARGKNMGDAIDSAKTYLTIAIENSLSLGQGHGPLNHMGPRK